MKLTREEIQKNAVNLALNNKNIAFQYATGIGKTYISLCCISALELEWNYKPKVLLLIAEKAHKKNWEDEFIKWNFNAENFTIECYASLKKYKDTQWDIILLDEAHRAGSDIRLDIFTTIKTKSLILLSATLQDSILESLSTIYGYIKSDKISLKDAIESKILPEPKVYLLPLTLNSTNRSETIIEQRGKKALIKTITCTLKERWTYLNNKAQYPNISLEMKCTEKEKYDYLCVQFEYWKSQYMKTRQERTKIKWLQLGAQRKRFLGECKTKYAKQLCQNLNNKYRYICFCNSISQADYLGQDTAIHSENKDSLKVIDKFNEGKINSLFAVSMAQEGLNLKDIEAGIIVQLDGYERAWIQKIGRIFRAKEPIQYIFYFKNTQDEVYLQKVLEGIDKEYMIKINNINDIIL